ncbi:MAG: CsbD family protein [Chloroflexota bacterium]
MSDQRIEGTWNDTKGKVKEGVGDMTDDERLREEGQADQVQGKLQKGLGDIQDGLRDAGDRLQDEIDKHR